MSVCVCKSAPRAKSGIPAGARVHKFGPEKGPKGPFSAKCGLLLCVYTSMYVKIGQNAVKIRFTCVKMESWWVELG